MKLAIVHDWLTGFRGGEKCLQWACRRFPDAELFTLLRVKGGTPPDIDGMPIRTSVLQNLPAARRYYRYLLPLMPWAIERLKLPADADLVLSFSHAVAKGVVPPPGVPHVCYCFTPMRYAWERRDDYFAAPSRRLGVFGRAAAWARDKLLDRIRAWDQQTSRRVTHFVAISQTVADRIRASYGRDSRIIYPPVDTDFYTPEADAAGQATMREDFFLCVSALVPYKRIDLAIACCNRLKRRLIVIGDGPQRRALARIAGPTVTLLGWQPDEVIRDHLRRCWALLFPGHEDFGIVPLEAQACGAPVIAFGRGGATETIVPIGDGEQGSGHFFHEQTPDALAEAIEWFERRWEMFSPAVARRSALRFTQERFCRELFGYIESLKPYPSASAACSASKNSLAEPDDCLIEAANLCKSRRSTTPS
jgi:glycosyltransferase involved in cell wall biosynthesis